MIKRNLPLMITIGVFVLGYFYCLTQFPGFASTRVICNILTDNAFLGIIAVGMTFVILSGGIDLSVGSVIAFTGVFLAKVIGDFGLSPLLAFPLVLVMGCAFGAFMGLLIDALKIPAFIITLAGMFFLRGVSYLVSEESIPINHPVYDTLSSLAWKIPGGGRLSAMGLLMLAVVVIGIFLAHRTRFGNQVYAIGGNATSANLMGISTRSTTIRIYMLSTGLATLAGIVFNAFAATDALGMVGCTGHIDVHLANLRARTARDAFACVDPNSQQGHLVHEPIECPQRANPLAERAVEQNAQHYHGNENEKFPGKELSQRRSDARISD